MTPTDYSTRPVALWAIIGILVAALLFTVTRTPARCPGDDLFARHRPAQAKLATANCLSSSYWFFTVWGKTIAVPFATCDGTAVNWPVDIGVPAADLTPLRLLSIAREWQATRLGALTSSLPGFNAKDLAAAVGAEGLVITGKSAVESKVSAAVLAVVDSLVKSDCISVRETNLHNLGELLVARAFEYAAFARLASPSAPPPRADFVLLPAVMKRNSEAEGMQHSAVALACLADLGLSGAGAVFVSSLEQYTILVTGGFSPFYDALLYKHPVLSRGVFITSASHAPHCFGAEGKEMMQLDAPYPNKLHARSPLPPHCRGLSPWPMPGGLRASERPLGIVLSSGERKDNSVRVSMRAKMRACAENGTHPGACAYLDINAAPGIKEPLLLTMALYGAARFCLMPTGDVPPRSGFYDAVLMGCIPISLPADRERAIKSCDNPWHYGNDVALPYVEALAELGMPLSFEPEYESGRFIETLLAIPLEKVDAVQARLLESAHGLQFREPEAQASHDDAVRHGMDAVDYVLESLALGKAFKSRRRR